MALIDLSGQVFGKLTIIKEAPRQNHNHIAFFCKCECGTFKTILKVNITSGRQISCGCHNRAIAKLSHTTHGLSKTKLYKIWSWMITRCENPNATHYNDYGGRGIAVCDEWREYIKFHKDMAEGYRRGLEIDRINNNGNYCKENCRWATKKQNSRNKRSNRPLTINGETKISVEWAEQESITPQLIHNRLKKGWSDEESVFGRLNKDGRKRKKNGKIWYK